MVCKCLALHIGQSHWKALDLLSFNTTNISKGPEMYFHGSDVGALLGKETGVPVNSSADVEMLRIDDLFTTCLTQATG